MIQIVRFTIKCFLLIGVACHVQAHQQKEAISSILFNDRTGNIEIAHRFYVHDAEHAVKHLLNNKADLIQDNKAQSAFADYVTKRFQLKLDQSTPLILQTVGFEVVDKFFWVYQEKAYLSKPKQIEVKFDALMELWASQRNIINFEGLGPIRSLELMVPQARKSIIFN